MAMRTMAGVKFGVDFGVYFGVYFGVEFGVEFSVEENQARGGIWRGENLPPPNLRIASVKTQKNFTSNTSHRVSHRYSRTKSATHIAPASASNSSRESSAALVARQSGGHSVIDPPTVPPGAKQRNELAPGRRSPSVSDR